ncbi:response regulator [bacterium]|nr:response regulator [bacterium]
MSASLPSVLIVDDNQDFCASLFDCFEENGFDCTAAVDPLTALHLARQKPVYDIALVDLNMPGMDGLTLFREMQSAVPRMQGILVTAFAGNETGHSARDAGFQHVIQKPVGFPDLLDLVRETAQPRRDTQ